MGRTTPTYRNALDGLESDWGRFRRGLRRQYQTDFDRLFDHGRAFADAAGYANPADPERALVLSILLAHQVELRELRARVEAAVDGTHEPGQREGDDAQRDATASRRDPDDEPNGV